METQFFMIESNSDPPCFKLNILLNLETCHILAVKYVVSDNSCSFPLSAFSKNDWWGILWRVSKNPGSSETSISLLLAAQPRSAITFSFFPSAHLISACLPLLFIPWSYLQRNAFLSLSQSFFLAFSLTLDSITLISFLFHAFILSLS